MDDRETGIAAPWAPAVLDAVLGFCGVGAAAGLVLAHGFYQPVIDPAATKILLGSILLLFLAQRLCRVALAPQIVPYLREMWLDLAVMAAGGVCFATLASFRAEILSILALYVLGTQGAALWRRLVAPWRKPWRRNGGGPPAWAYLAGGILVLTGIGSGLLMLPVMRPEGSSVRYHDMLLLAAGASTMTSLSVKSMAVDFTVWGQALVLLLVQLGALLVLYFGTLLAMLLGKRLTTEPGVGDRDEGIDPAHLGRYVLATALTLEAVGAILLMPMFLAIHAGEVHKYLQAAWESLFHGVCAFCNAGFSTFDRNFAQGAGGEGQRAAIRQYWQVYGVVAPMVVLGGLGLPVLDDCAAWVKSRWERLWSAELRQRQPRAFPLPLHSRLTLAATAVLLLAGPAILLLVEPEGTAAARKKGSFGVANVGYKKQYVTDWENASLEERVGPAAFTTIAARSAGFYAMDPAELSNAGKLWLCGLMTAGAGPSGTGGGLKPITLTILLLLAWSVCCGRGETQAPGGSLPAPLVRLAGTMAVLYLSLLSAVVLALSAILPDAPMIDVLFESCSALGNVGLSSGLTANLDMIPQIVLVTAMLLGRLLPLGILLAMAAARPDQYAAPPDRAIVLG